MMDLNYTFNDLKKTLRPATIFGALGGRIDHMLANAFLPSNPKLAPLYASDMIEDGQNLPSIVQKGVS